MGDVLQFTVKPAANKAVETYVNGSKIEGVAQADGSIAYVVVVSRDKMELRFEAYSVYRVSGRVQFKDDSYAEAKMLLDGVDYSQYLEASGDYSFIAKSGAHKLYFANAKYEDIIEFDLTADLGIPLVTASLEKPLAKTRAVNDDGLKAGEWNLVSHGAETGAEYGVSENEGNNTITQMMIGSAYEYVLEANIRRADDSWDANCQVGFVVYAKDEISVMVLLNLRDSSPYMRVWNVGRYNGDKVWIESQLLIRDTFPEAAKDIMSERKDFKMTVVKKGDFIYLFLNDVYAHRFNAEYGPAGAENGEGTFGFAVRGKSNNGTTFYNYSYSLSQEAIDNRLKPLDLTPLKIGVAENSAIDIHSVTANGTVTNVKNNKATIYLAAGTHNVYFDCGEYEALETVTVKSGETNEIVLAKA